MITEFEHETVKLNDHERNVLMPLLVNGLRSRVGKGRAVTNKYISQCFAKQNEAVGGVRIRKLINYIRVNNLIPLLLATSSGYYVADNKDEVLTYIQSLKERADSINYVRECLISQLKVLGEDEEKETNKLF